VLPRAADALSPAELALVREVAGRAVAVLVKGLLHRLDARAFPVPRDVGSLEAHAAVHARRLRPATVERLVPRLERIAGDPAGLARALHLPGPPDFGRPEAVAPPVPAAPPRAAAPLPRHPAAPSAPAARPAGRRVARLPAFNVAHLALRAVHCARAGERVVAAGGAGEGLVLGCTLVDGVGRPAGTQAHPLGALRPGERASFGEVPLGRVDLGARADRRCAYAVLQALRAHGDDELAAAELRDRLAFAALLVAGLLPGPASTAVVGDAVELTGDLLAVWLDDELLRPVGVPLALSGSDPFGGHRSGDLRAPDVTGRGDVLRFGYRWRLAV
jgi:hypothetical protein